MSDNQPQIPPKEPMIAINHTGWGVKVKDLITIGALIFVGGGAYVAVTSQLSTLESRLKIVPAEVQEDVRTMAANLSAEIKSLSQRVETSRVERLSDVKDLTRRVAQGEAERAKIGQQVNNLDELLRDIRGLMRDENKRTENSKQ